MIQLNKKISECRIYDIYKTVFLLLLFLIPLQSYANSINYNKFSCAAYSHCYSDTTNCKNYEGPAEDSEWNNHSIECKILRFFIPQNNSQPASESQVGSSNIYQDVIVFSSYIAYAIAVYIVCFVMIKTLIVGAATGDFMPKSGLFLFVRIAIGFFLLLPFQPSSYSDSPPDPNYQYSYAHHFVFTIADKGILLAYEIYNLMFVKVNGNVGSDIDLCKRDKSTVLPNADENKNFLPDCEIENSYPSDITRGLFLDMLNGISNFIDGNDDKKTYFTGVTQNDEEASRIWANNSIYNYYKKNAESAKIELNSWSAVNSFPLILGMSIEDTQIDILKDFFEQSIEKQLSFNFLRFYKELGSGIIHKTDEIIKKQFIANIAMSMISNIGGSQTSFGSVFNATQAALSFYFSLQMVVGFGLGAILSIGLPLIPMLAFIGQILAWIIAIFELMILAPFIAVGLMWPTDSADELLGRVEPSLYFIFNVFLRPSLILISILMGLYLAWFALYFFNLSYAIGFAKGYIVNAGIWSGPAYSAIYAGSVMGILIYAFSVVHVIPDKILTLISGPDPGWGQKMDLSASASSGDEADTGGVSFQGDNQLINTETKKDKSKSKPKGEESSTESKPKGEESSTKSKPKGED